jgi:uncharacterized Zn finger protein (UPF0148 family)
VEYSVLGFCVRYGDARTIYSDLDRILCVLDAKPFDKCHTIGEAIESKCREVRYTTTSGGWKFESEYFEGRFFKKGTVHLKWKRQDLLEAFSKTAAAGKKWLGENTQQYRPKKKREEPEWYCEKNGHNFKDGVCERCGDPEIDEVAAVECELCRAIFEHTGRVECPIHGGLSMMAAAPPVAMIEEGRTADEPSAPIVDADPPTVDADDEQAEEDGEWLEWQEVEEAFKEFGQPQPPQAELIPQPLQRGLF